MKLPPCHILSKSTFVKGCQCEKALYLSKFHRGLRQETSIQQRAIFDQGTSIGELAQNLFPGGVDASPETPYEYKKSVVKYRITRSDLYVLIEKYIRNNENQELF